MDILKRPTLVLNKSWVPISTVTVQDAITMLCGGFVDARGRRLPKAEVLDVETWQTYKWETKDGVIGWKDLPVKEGEPAVHSAHSVHRVPEIIIVARYQKIPKNQLNFNQKNLFRRDGDICQYCGEKGADTIDHVLPRSRGGKSTWHNCVICCFSCNQRKKDRTPEEADMKLLREPCKPGLEILGQTKIRMKSWEIFFKGKTHDE